jgi:hypothetical protein
MLQAHSILWHYLWVAPNLLLLVLAFFLVKRGLGKQHAAFLAFAALSAIAELAVYAADVLPWVTPLQFWSTVRASLLIEGPAKFVLIGAIFAHAFGDYPSLARLGKILIRAVGIFLVLTAAVAAAYAQKDSPFGIIAGVHVLEEAIYLIEAGLLVFIFSFSFYFHLSLDRRLFGIALGMGISACVHLSTWAITANAVLPPTKRVALDFVNMGTYNICVLIWFYYLLVPRKVEAKTTVPPRIASAGTPVEDDLAVWNRELERLIHQ